MLVSIAEILKKEGYIANFNVVKAEPQSTLSVDLKYVNGEPAITGVKRKSKPGRRIYVGYTDITRVKDGYGISILSTPKGIMTGSQARKLKVAGEYLCEIY
jgi:small subunit ribosomal protein S8